MDLTTQITKRNEVVSALLGAFSAVAAYDAACSGFTDFIRFPEFAVSLPRNNGGGGTQQRYIDSETLADAVNDVDGEFWNRLARSSGLLDEMTEAQQHLFENRCYSARRTRNSSINVPMPQFNQDNIVRFNETMASERDERIDTLLRDVFVAFTSRWHVVDPTKKTWEDGYQTRVCAPLKKKEIIEGFTSTGHTAYLRAIRLHNLFAMIDPDTFDRAAAKQETEMGISSLRYNRPLGKVTTRYFTVETFANGNAHVTAFPKDLLAALNARAARVFGAAFMVA